MSHLHCGTIQSGVRPGARTPRTRRTSVGALSVEMVTVCYLFVALVFKGTQIALLPRNVSYTSRFHRFEQL